MDSGEESSKQSLTERPSAGASSSPAQQKQQRGTTQRQQQFSAKFKTDLNRSVQEILFLHVRQAVMMELIKRVMRMIRVIRRVMVIKSSCIGLTF
ncbi:uncharacterized protein LOC114076559 isoform X2 [Solanum pennellii]|uniref:Uncharacterized protein LOC114076559 isoform X2 n=1 Tax=Solanum pennellii TaxID=28526 RepID=A0ABM1V7G5_SOLPN|nr:uncharacterized protein LOC114076559 isoform X2 [Solanum pennellii]